MASKKKTNWGRIFAWFIIFLMVTSTLGLLVGPFGNGGSLVDESIKVNGHKLSRTQNGFEGKFNDARVAFVYAPAAANRTKLPPGAIEAIRQSRFLYMTSDPNSTSAEDIAYFQYQIGQILTNEFGVQTQIAFTTPFSTFPVIRCENASTFVPVIELAVANETAAWYSNNCLTLTAQNPNAFIELRDRVLYGLFGVLP